jgi:hypothetical protein
MNSRQGQGNSSIGNALIVFADYKKAPLQHWNEDPFKFWSMKKGKVFFVLFFQSQLNICAYQPHLFLLRNFFRVLEISLGKHGTGYFLTMWICYCFFIKMLDVVE